MITKVLTRVLMFYLIILLFTLKALVGFKQISESSMYTCLPSMRAQQSSTVARVTLVLQYVSGMHVLHIRRYFIRPYLQVSYVSSMMSCAIELLTYLWDLLNKYLEGRLPKQYG